MKAAQRHRGFTLIEIIVVIGLLGVISTLGSVLFYKMSDGWQRILVRAELDAKADRIFNSMRADFAHVLSANLSQVPLRGFEDQARLEMLEHVPVADDRIVIPVQVPAAANSRTVSQSVMYKIAREAGEDATEQVKDALVRTVGPLGVDDPQNGRIDLCEGVVGMRIEYAEGSGDWSRGWTKQALPDNVRVCLVLSDPVFVDYQVARTAVFSINVD